MEDLAGSQELEHMLGVSRQRVQQLIGHADFPVPVAVLAMGKVWRKADVVAWATARGRQLADQGDGVHQDADRA
ncbi:DNA-binding protein (plasmid) [Pseudonocardia oceani]|uniref:DNA-binding protein n=2 Tax=Pseudonocardia oceani TaxID=2792013 RepID=A0ABS6UJV7_9PSEU|nr:DNA-binding protein [Pseudonocardia oceani]MBW0132528.1 DNA-binding protein [Pseudonocardia oceani]